MQAVQDLKRGNNDALELLRQLARVFHLLKGLRAEGDLPIDIDTPEGDLDMMILTQMMPQSSEHQEERRRRRFHARGGQMSTLLHDGKKCIYTKYVQKVVATTSS